MTHPTPPGRPSNSLHQAVGELGGKVDTILLTLLPQVSAIRMDQDKLSERVTVLEVWKGRAMGGAAVVGFLFTSYEVVFNVLHIVPKR